ncbi:hypothetical protein KZP23_22735 [Echinicola marina]|uniref:hypothetical protein n=1 Tax=Echinicola marina TaxID=2859768 RepID=UPI001CF6AF0C|nr:hypothetical protein [Echinicola marina]UCS93419.1 hypothetical protein KZP23_22735 [Echinicola marina]
MRNSINLVLIFVFVSFNSFGQIANVEMNGVPLRVSSYEGILGSPFLFDDWSNASYTMEKGWTKENVPTKINVYEKEILAANDNGNQIVLDKKQIYSFVLNRPQDNLRDNDGALVKMVFKKGFDEVPGVSESDFVNVLLEGENYVLVRVFKNKLETPPKNSYSPSPGKRFIPSESYYLINSSGEAISVRLSNRSMVKSLDSDDQKEGKKYLKENKLNLNREDHLIQFLVKMNEIS